MFKDILYETCVSVSGNKQLLWPQARAFGLGYWMKNLETLVGNERVTF
jgi:hypothetical protein